MTMSMERQKQFQKHGIGWRTVAMLLCFIAILAARSVAAADSIVIVSVPGNGAHQRFSSAFRAELSRIEPEINIIEQSLDDYTPSNNGPLVVTLGSRAFRKTTYQPGVMFHSLISKELYKEYHPNDQDGKYYLVFNQPLKRMLRFHAVALPQSKNIGVLLGHPDSYLINKLNREADVFGKRVVIEQVEDDFSESLSTLLSKIDSLLLFPDSTVINRSTINSLVLDSYDKQIPLLGYSRSLVKAGAMLAIYSTPEQLGKETAQLIDRIISGERIPTLNYPKQFEVSVNYKLSRVYGITIPSERELHNKVAVGERE